MAWKGKTQIEVKVLRSQSGEVVFLESGPDFVELLFNVMSAPLSSLLPTISGKGVDKDDLHTLVGLKKSLLSLGSQSFVTRRPASYIPQTLSMEQLMQCAIREGNETPGSDSEESQIVPADPHHSTSQQIVWPRSRCSIGHSGPASARQVEQHKKNKDESKRILKDNCKFMVTDSLEVFESSTIMAMELMKEYVDDFRRIKTSTEFVDQEIAKKLVLCSMLGSKTVLSEIFPETDAYEKESSIVSDGSFEAIDAGKGQKWQQKGRRAGKQGK